MAKQKRYTRRQLTRLRLQREAEVADARRAERLAAKRAARRDYSAFAMFHGCDPDRTLDLLGEDA